MTEKDFDEFENVISGVGDLYGKKMSEWGLSIWWEALKNYDMKAVRDALSKHVRNPDTGQFMPKPADVVKMIGGSTVDSALVAWTKVDKAVRQVGSYTDVVFDDPVIHRVIDDMGGWIALGTKTENDWPFIAKEFENRYRGYSIRGAVPEYQNVLVGIANAQNQRHGFDNQEPVLIGNAKQARHVMSLGGGRSIGITRLEINTKRLGLA